MRRRLQLRELPLLAMDASFVTYQQLTPEQVRKRLDELVTTVRKYRGHFVLLWHNSSFFVPPWPALDPVLVDLLTGR